MGFLKKPYHIQGCLQYRYRPDMFHVLYIWTTVMVVRWQQGHGATVEQNYGIMLVEGFVLTDDYVVVAVETGATEILV